MDDPDRPPDSHLFSLRYLVLVNLMTCGLELCTSAAFGYLPPLLLEEGISETRMSVIIAIGPMIALVLLPLMGTLSDSCTSPYGRRRPFLVLLGGVTVISMMTLAYPGGSESLMSYIVAPERAKFIVLAISIVTFDLATQISFTPMESLLSDSCRTDEHHNKSFVVFTFLLSTGACVGYWLLSVDWGGTALGALLGGQRECIFVILCVIFLFSAWISLITAYDPQIARTRTSKSLPEARTIDDKKGSHEVSDDRTLSRPNGIIHSSDSQELIPSTSTEIVTYPAYTLPCTPIFHNLSSKFLNCSKCVCPGKCSTMFGLMGRTIEDTLTSLRTMPRALQKLWVANLLSNAAVIGFRIYFTDYVGETLYRGNPGSMEGSDERNLYDAGVRMGSWGLFLHSLVSGVTSLFFERTVSWVGERGVFLYGMLLFTISTALMLCMDNIPSTIILAAGTGIGTAITSLVPYTLLSGYHENSAFFFSDLKPQHSHLHGKGADFSLLDSGMILSEIIAPIFFGLLVGYTKSSVTYIACATMFGLLSCVSIWLIEYPAMSKGPVV